METKPAAARFTHALVVASILALGGFGFLVVWLAAALSYGDRAGWMAPVAAGVAIACLRLARSRSGLPGALLAVLATGVYVTVGEWVIACVPIAQAMGQSPFEAASRTGVDFAWMLIRLGNTPVDWVLAAIALAIAGWFGR